MDKVTQLQNHLEEAQMLVQQGKDSAAIEAILLQKGIEASIVNETLAHLKRLRNAKRTKNGTLLVLIGVLILGTGFISCVIIHFNGGSIDFSLFGLTSIGAIALIAGLALIFS